jgi:hypothetical protein
MPDIMVGNIRGGLFFLGSKNNGQEILVDIKKPLPPVSLDANLYPNPSTGEFYLSYSWPGNPERATYAIYDLVGRRVQEGNFLLEQGKGEEKISLPSSGAGIYFLIANNSEGQCILSRKIVINKP